MKLVDLLDIKKQLYLSIDGDISNIEIASLSQDSRNIGEKCLFFCVSGKQVDGHIFAKKAQDKGAVCVVSEKKIVLDVPVIYVNSVVKTMAFLAMRFYHNPSFALPIVAVTGTNGKTTTTYLVRYLLQTLHGSCGMIGTNGIWYNHEHIYSPNTTPDALTMQKYLRKMVDDGQKFCAAEVSSHALVMGRVKNISFQVAVFTNLTHEHLETHHTMSEYCMAKSLLFAQLGSGNENKVAILNKDDHYASIIANRCNANIWYYSTKDKRANFYAKDIIYSVDKTIFTLVFQNKEYQVEIPLIGEFNVANTLAALAAYYALQRNLDEAIAILPQFPGVAGRMEKVENNLGINAIVDFAHTPDGLKKAMQALRRIKHKRIITMIGHDGGNRDPSIRSSLGRIALEHSDYVIFTSENPRNEDPLKIMQAMVADTQKQNYEFIVDRKEAIFKVVSLAHKGDILFFTGKGYEAYQLINDQKIPFNEVQYVKEALMQKEHAEMAK